MMFLFAYLASFRSPPAWPILLMYLTEAMFVIAAFVCVWLAITSKGVGTQRRRDIVAVVGGINASLGLIMPFELAPFFFGAPGEIMLATMGLIVVYPIAAILFIFLLRVLMKWTCKPTTG